MKDLHKAVYGRLSHSRKDMFCPDPAGKAGRDQRGVVLKINRHFRAGVPCRLTQILQFFTAWLLAQNGGLYAQDVQAAIRPVCHPASGPDEPVAVPLSRDAYHHG